MNKRWFYPLLLCLMLIFGPVQARAQQQAITWDMSAGFDGAFKTGAWFPVTITISNSGPDIQATLSISFRGGGTAYQQPVDLPSGANKRVVMPVINNGDQFGNSRIDVTLREGSRVIRSETLQLTAIGRGWNVVGVLSDEEGALAELSTFESLSASPISLVRLTSADLPDRLELLQALDVLFVQAADTNSWTDAQRAALRVWIEEGGQLVVGGDERVTRGLADLLPATVSGTGNPANLQGLGAIGWPLRDAEREVPLLQLAPQPNAQVLAAGETGQALLIRQQYGTGQIIQAAFNLQALRDVGNPVELWVRLLDLNRENLSLWEGLRNQGFSILRESLKLPQLSFLSGIGLFGFLAVYILVVGPINYLLLRRWNRREWAYLTIPLWVVLFSLGAYAWGTLGRGSSTLVNQLAIIRVAQGSEQGKALTYLSIFSPTRTTYSLGFAPDAFVSDAVPEWQRSSTNFDVLYSEDSVRVPDLNVDVGGISLLSVEQPVAAPSVTATIHEVNGQEQMTVRNLSDRRLTDVVLFRGDGNIQVIESLEAGVERTIVLNPNRSFLEAQISDGETVQRHSVIRQLGMILAPGNFGVFGAPPDIGMAQPVPMPAIPTAAPVAPGPDLPQPVPGMQTDPRQIWYVLAWDAQAPVAVTVDGSPVNARGEALYIWTAQKEQ